MSPRVKPSSPGWPSRDILRAAAIVAAVYVALRLLWVGHDVVLIGFFGVLLGIVLTAGVDRLERFRIPPDQLDEHLQLLNLVNFGGGCYAVYARLEEGDVYVEKELFGDAFRRAPRLTPLEARAIRLALEFVGPMIAAEAHTSLTRVRDKLEETFGQFELRETPEPPVPDAEEELIATLSQAIQQRRLAKIEYLSPGAETTTTRVVEPYGFERKLPFWYVHTWDRTVDGPRWKKRATLRTS